MRFKSSRPYMSDIFMDTITRSRPTEHKMAEAALKSVTDVVTGLGLQQKVELKTTLQKISPHDFRQTSVPFLR